MERNELTMLGMALVAVFAAFAIALACGAVLHLRFGEWAGWFSTPIFILLGVLFLRKWWLWALK